MLASLGLEDGPALAQVGHGHDLDARPFQRSGRLEPAIGCGGDDRAGSRGDAVEGDEPPHAAGEHHAGQVVAGEDERLLDDAGGEDELARAHLMQGRGLPDGDEAVEGAEHRGGGEELDAGAARLLGQLAGALVAALGQRAAAGLGALVGEHDVGAGLGGRDRRAQPGEAAPDDEHVGVAAAVLGAPLALVLGGAQLAQAGGVAQHLLVHRPQASRADEGLVVEARRRERAADRVGDGHDVVLEAGGGVEVLDLHALAHRLGAGAHARRAVDRDQAVRALPRAAQQAAPAVVLEAARERALAGCVERRGDGVARQRLDALAVEGEADGGGAIDALAGLRRGGGS